MKLGEIFRFEFGYQARRVTTWAVFIALVVVVVLFSRDNSIAEALLDDFFLNSPFAVAKNMVLGSLIWLLIGASTAGDAAARDVATGMHPLSWTTPVTRTAYLGGRFLGALAANLMILLAIPLGVLLAIYAPGIGAELVGPFRLAAYVNPFFIFVLPTAFAATAIQFTIATVSGRPMAGYLGSLFLFFMSWIVAGIVYSVMGRPELGRMLDAVGAINVVQEMSTGWTPAEKRVRLIAAEGALLWNRLLWIGVGLGALGLTGLRFRFAHRAEGRRWLRFKGGSGSPQGLPTADAGITSGSGSTPVPQPTRAMGARLTVRQVLALAASSYRSLALSWGGLGSFVLIPLLTLIVVSSQIQLNGIPLIASTARVVDVLVAPLADELTPWILIPLLLIYFAGELVWRERDTGLDEITDAMPLATGVSVLGNFLGLGMLLATWIALLMVGGVAIQLLRGVRELQIVLYLGALFGLQFMEYLLLVPLVLGIHAVVNHKYIGHMVALMAYVFIVIGASLLGIDHRLLVWGSGPAWSYTDMMGFGPTLGPWAWFRAYWGAWAGLALIVASLLYARGGDTRISERMAQARQRLAGPMARAALLAVGLTAGLGGFVYYNTNVLNAYATADQQADWHEAYERRFGRFESLAQPRVAATELRVELWPDRRAADITGRYQLVNSSLEPIDTILVAPAPGVEAVTLELDRAAMRLRAGGLEDEADILDDSGPRVYVLESSLAPGDSAWLAFEIRVAPRGFSESGVDLSIVGNGTFVSTVAWLPRIGFQADRLITSPSERRARELPPRAVIPVLEDSTANEAWAGRIMLDAVVGTYADQIVVAPGTLQQTWTEGERRYFHYRTDAPIGFDQSIFSADYAVREDRWKEVAIRIFHHPGHTAALDRMIASVHASLAEYSERYGSYPWSQITLVERPGHGVGMSANASMVNFGEGFPQWDPGDSALRLDMPFAVVAHELGHQWWGAQLPYAFVEGAPVLSEGLAWYSALQVVEATYGTDQMRALLRFMRRPYPIRPIRLGRPLLRGLDPWMAYRKGPYALHALREYMGADRVDRALRTLLDKHRSGAPPLATTLDLYRELKAVTPDSIQPLLHDLFEVNVIWEFAVDRATATARDDGAWDVAMDIRARKVVVDTAGVETDLDLDAWIEVGVFGRPEAGRDRLSQPLHLARHRIRSGDHTLTITVQERPVLAGIDPHHVLDWEEREDDDNIERVVVRTRPAEGGAAGG